MGLAGGERPGKDRRTRDRVHSNAVTEKSPPGGPAARIDQQQADAPVWIVAPEAAHDLVDDTGLTRTTGSCESDHGHGSMLVDRVELSSDRVGRWAVRLGFQGGDQPGRSRWISAAEPAETLEGVGPVVLF